MPSGSDVPLFDTTSEWVPGHLKNICVNCDSDTKGVPVRRPALPQWERLKLTNSQLPMVLDPVPSLTFMVSPKQNCQHPSLAHPVADSRSITTTSALSEPH